MSAHPVVWTSTQDPPRPPRGLSREWASTADIAAAAGIAQRRAHPLLNGLRMRGLIQRTRRGRDLLWRIAPGASVDRRTVR